MAKARTRAARPPAPGVGSTPPAPGDGYHHGDLRAALIAAAEEELAEKGVEGFTLRGCARRAGVSHAAPAHHFKDVRALLTALATDGFRGLCASMAEAAASCAPGSLDYIVAIGGGYVDFAVNHPAPFRLIFSVASLDSNDPDYARAARAAFAYPVDAVGAYYGSDDAMADARLAEIVVGIWSMVHGFSTLLLAGQFDRHMGCDRPAIATRMVAPMLVRYFAADEAQRRTTKSRRTKPAAQ